MADSVLRGDAVWLGGFQHFWVWGQLITGAIEASMGNRMNLGRLSEVLELVSGLVMGLLKPAWATGWIWADYLRCCSWSVDLWNIG